MRDRYSQIWTVEKIGPEKFHAASMQRLSSLGGELCQTRAKAEEQAMKGNGHVRT